MLRCNKCRDLPTGFISPGQPAIVRLHRIFGPYGSVEFMSCKTGRGVDGRVTTIATLIGVPVSELAYSGLKASGRQSWL
jgi:hypothetical protein